MESVIGKIEHLQNFSDMAKLVKGAVNWVKNQSDLTHTSMTIGCVSAGLPFLPSLSASSLLALNMSSTGIQLGTQVYVGCVAGPTMFLNMARSDFGNIQARLFPKMGLLTVGTGMASLASYLVHHTIDPLAWNLVVSLVANSLNALLVFPATTSLMFKLRLAGEGTDERKKLGAKFGIMHLVSVLLNTVSMGANIAYFYLLASQLAPHW